MVGLVVRATMAVGLVGGSVALAPGSARAVTGDGYGQRAPATGRLPARAQRLEATSLATISAWVAQTSPLARTRGPTALGESAGAPSPVVTTTTPVAPPAPGGLGELAAAVAAVVPAWARSAVQPDYQIGPGGCGDGCTSPGDPPTTRFSPWVFTQSFAFVEAAVAHEYAHALGFSHLAAYRFSDWSQAPEAWARQFHVLDASIRGSDDREAFAACMARAWTGGYPWVPDQVRGECPLWLASWVNAQAEQEVTGSPST